MKKFILLLRATKKVMNAPRSPEAARESGERWHAWGEALRTGGHLVDAAELDGRGRVLRGPEGTVTEGAFPEEHLVGGYFVVSAAGLDEATELARGCPLLRNGGAVEVRPFGEG